MAGLQPRDLTECERQLWHAVKAGAPVDLRSGSPELDDPVLTAISLTGGVRRWAADFDMPRDSPRHSGPIRYWTDDRIRAHLTELCQGRTTFPSRQDFHRAGLQGLHHILQRGHTIDRRARDFRLPRQPGGPSTRKPSTAAPDR